MEEQEGIDMVLQTLVAIDYHDYKTLTYCRLSVDLLVHIRYPDGKFA